MVDIARLYHPAYSNDPRILAWCAALPEVSDCSSASVTPARAQWCCRSRVKAQIDPRVLLADAAGRDHCPARRVGQSARLRRLLDLPTVGIPPTAPCSPEPRRQPTAVGPQRAADPQRVVAYWVRTRASAHPHVVHPGWRVNLPTAVQLVLAATAHRRTPEHAARCPPQRPDCSPTGIRARPHAVTSAVTIDILLRPTATEPNRHETAWRSPCPAPTAAPGPHRPNTNLPSPDIAGLPSPPRRSRSPPANSTLPPSVTCRSCSTTKCSPRPRGVTPHVRLANPTDSPPRLSDTSCDTSVTITRAAGNNEMCSPARGKPGSRLVSAIEGMREATIIRRACHNSPKTRRGHAGVRSRQNAQVAAAFTRWSGAATRPSLTPNQVLPRWRPR